MKVFSIMCRAAPLALVLAAACQPVRAPHPAAAPAPVAALTPEHEAMLDAMLKAHFGGRPVDPKTRDTYRRLMAVALATPEPLASSSSPLRPSPAVQRALRELQASTGTTEDMRRILREYVAEAQAAESREP